MKKEIKLNKGFTLVELLAVIVILGVLLLIAVPTVTQLIDNSKEKVFLTDAQMFINAAKTQMASLGYAANEKVFKIEELLDENVDSKYTGYVSTEKNEATGEYEYGIFLWDTETNKIVGDIDHHTAVVTDELSVSKPSDTELALFELLYADTAPNKALGTTFLNQKGEKKFVDDEGNVRSLVATADSSKTFDFTPVYLDHKDLNPNDNITLDKLQFRVINDTGNKLYLLFIAPDLTIANAHWKKGIYHIGSNCYNKKYSDVENIISVFYEQYGDAADEIRLLTFNDLFTMFGEFPTEASVDAIKSLLIKNHNYLTYDEKEAERADSIFPANTNLALIIDENTKPDFNRFGTVAGDLSKKSLYGITPGQKDSIVQEFTSDTPFYIPIVFEVSGEKRNKFYTNSIDTNLDNKTSSLKEF